MARKALLKGWAGNYRIRGAIWGLGHFAYRAYLHLLPTRRRPDLFEVLPKTAPTPQPDTEHSPPLRQRHAPPLTD